MEFLIKKAKKDDVEAFISLMDLLKPSMYKNARAILNNDEDAADAIQETILSCYKNISTLKDIKYFKTWVTKILINNCNDIIRKNKNLIYIDKYQEEGYIENIDERLTLKECFDSLSNDYKIVMTLYYSDGFNSREISEILDLNESTVKTKLSRGRDYFKRYYLKNHKEA